MGDLSLPKLFNKFFIIVYKVVPIDGLSSKEKVLLTLLGRDPDIPSRELLEATGYQCATTISKKKKDLYKRGYMRGPYYHINLNAVGQNELFDIYADIEFDASDYNLVFNLIQAIKCWRWIFPAIQGDRFFVYFQCNYYTQVAHLLNILKKEGIIDYNFYSSQNRWMGENPNLSGKEILSYENLFAECELPQMSYPFKKIIKPWRQLDVKIMAYLQVRSVDTKFIHKFEQDFYDCSWKKNQIKYSIRKLIEYDIAERKHYNVAPYPRDKCFSFLMFVETKDITKTLQAMVNLGRGCRIYKAYTLAGETGIMLSWASAQNMPGFLSAVEDMDDVWVRAYQLKTHNTPYMVKQSFSVKNFNIENQRWIFPYQEYEREIEHLLEKRKE